MRRVHVQPWPRPIRVAIVLAAAFTAGVHLYLAVAPNSPQPQLRPLFALAAVGFAGTTIASFAPLEFLGPIRWLARLTLMSIDLSAVIAYLVVMGFVFDTLSMTDKSVEVILMVLLVVDGVEARRMKTPSVTEEQAEPQRPSTAA